MVVHSFRAGHTMFRGSTAVTLPLPSSPSPTATPVDMFGDGWVAGNRNFPLILHAFHAYIHDHHSFNSIIHHLYVIVAVCIMCNWLQIYASHLASFPGLKFPAKRSLYAGGFCACGQLCAALSGGRPGNEATSHPFSGDVSTCVYTRWKHILFVCVRMFCKVS